MGSTVILIYHSQRSEPLLGLQNLVLQKYILHYLPVGVQQPPMPATKAGPCIPYAVPRCFAAENACTAENVIRCASHTHAVRNQYYDSCPCSSWFFTEFVPYCAVLFCNQLDFDKLGTFLSWERNSLHCCQFNFCFG